mmetsp:Transcript_30196/g.84361  ORF Transcript_30196/g.84361 Transcript_30196/m.84361 type:complete len:106 (-) Transcript_30196:29-346(-)
MLWHDEQCGLRQQELPPTERDAIRVWVAVPAFIPPEAVVLHPQRRERYGRVQVSAQRRGQPTSRSPQRRVERGVREARPADDGPAEILQGRRIQPGSEPRSGASG